MLILNIFTLSLSLLYLWEFEKQGVVSAAGYTPNGNPQKHFLLDYSGFSKKIYHRNKLIEYSFESPCLLSRSIYECDRGVSAGEFTENDRYPLFSLTPRVKRRTPSCEDSWHTDATPFVTMILYKNSGRLLCMGSIIDRYHILSAKRCFDRATMETLIVLAGFVRPYWGKNSQVKYVEKIIRHERELALLRLKKPLLFNAFVKPAVLPGPKSKLKPINQLYEPPYGIIGVPVIRWDVPGEPLPRDSYYELRDEPFVAEEECKRNYTTFYTDFKRMFCTNGNATFCWGCIGAPSVIIVEDELVQIGVIYASNCTDFVGPIVHVRTDFHDRWIRSNSYLKETD